MTRTRSDAWSLGRNASAAVAALLLVVGYMLATGGAALLWSDRSGREGGYVWSPPVPDATSGYALTSDDIHLNGGPVQEIVDKIVSRVQVKVTPSAGSGDLFVGVARSADVAEYLRGVGYRQVGVLGQGGAAWGWLGSGVTSDLRGGPPATRPADAHMWLAQSSGTGTRTLTWSMADGDWNIVIMRSDGGPGVAASARTGAAAPDLPWVAGGLLTLGTALVLLGARLAFGGRAPGASSPPFRPPPTVGPWAADAPDSTDARSSSLVDAT